MKSFSLWLAGRAHDGTLQGVRDLPQNWVQALRSLPGVRGSGSDRQEQASLSVCPSTPLSGGELHPQRQARVRPLGRSYDPRAPDPLFRRFSDIKIPGKSAIHAVLDRDDLVERRGRVRRHAQGTADIDIEFRAETAERSMQR